MDGDQTCPRDHGDPEPQGAAELRLRFMRDNCFLLWPGSKLGCADHPSTEYKSCSQNCMTVKIKHSGRWFLLVHGSVDPFRLFTVLTLQRLQSVD